MATPQICLGAPLFEHPGSRLLSSFLEPKRSTPFASTGGVTALVVRDALPISEQTETISKVALDRLNSLREKMLKNFRAGEDHRVLEFIQLYQKQIENTLRGAMTSLGNLPFFTHFKRTLFLNSCELENIKKICEKKGAQREQIESEFLSQVDQLHQGLPQEIETYLQDLQKKIREAFLTKNQGLNAVADHYMQQIGVLENFLSGSTAIVPSFSLYGEIEQQMLRYKTSLKALQSDVLMTMRHLSDPTNILSEIQKKISQTYQRLEANKNRALGNLRKALTESSLEDSVDLSEQLEQVNEIYLQGLQEYIKFVQHSLNELVKEITECLLISLQSQEDQILLLMNKSKSVIDYLEYESSKILQMANMFQKPIVSREYGEKKGIFFNTSDSLVDGRISKISIGAKDTIESLQVVYVDPTGKVKTGPVFGKSIPHNKEICVSLDEKIHKVVVGALPLKKSKQSSRIGNIALHVRNHEGRGVHVYNLTAKKSSDDEFEEISFEDSYYLSGIRGYASAEGIHSLSFIFSKDFSGILKKDLSSRIQAAIEVVAKEPSCLLSDSEKETIQQMFLGQVFVDLDKSQSDPYGVLGLSKNASFEEVKKAFHNLAKKYHPDKAESYKVGLYKRRFEEISAAYQSLETLFRAPVASEAKNPSLTLSLR
jgi:hypothetical protein